MKRFVPVTMILLALLIGSAMPAQATPGVAWSRQFGSGGGSNDATTAVADSGGFIYATGFVSSAIPGETELGGQDAFLAKYTEDGTLVWVRQFGTALDDGGDAVTVTSQGIFVGGITDGNITAPSKGSDDVFIRQYDESGNVVKTVQFGTSGEDGIDQLIPDAGGFLATGRTDGALPHQSYAGQDDVFVRQLTTGLKPVWTREFGTSKDDGASAAIKGKSIYLAGYTHGHLPHQTTAGLDDAFAMKMTSAGNKVWVHEFGTTDDDAGYAAATIGRNFYVIGSTGGTLGSSSFGEEDGFMRKYTPKGAVIFTKQFGTDGFDNSFVVTKDSTGLTIGGNTNGSFPGFTMQGVYDIFLLHFTATGTQDGTMEIGSTAYDQIDDAAVISFPDFVIGGDTEGTLPSSTGTGNAFVMRATT